MSDGRGRPLRIPTPEEFERLVDEYLAECAARDKPVTITGALIHLGLSSRTSLLDYEGREGFSEPVKRLRLQVENAYESRLHGNSPTGAIFALKNMGWEDRSQREISGAENGPLVVMWGGKE
jgi:hypothetical protein